MTVHEINIQEIQKFGFQLRNMKTESRLFFLFLSIYVIGANLLN